MWTHMHDTHTMHMVACIEISTLACISEHLHPHTTRCWTKAGQVPPWGRVWKGGLGDEREV